MKTSREAAHWQADGEVIRPQKQNQIPENKQQS